MKFCFLTDNFFELYKDCEEIEKKNNRPYATVCLLKYKDLYFAIPIRHHIKHQYAIFTDKEKTKGLDLSKTLIIKDLKYIKALEHQDIKKNYLLCSMSCLKYFHDELNIKTSY